ncbi:CocE/NonD family hydrolase [Duganella sp. FT50W]|uniref:CocE/NonD family hydrolase n=1 Tax=Duganella lactea TaxID=2692173 RepID=A0A6L8MPN2_9BURK|nr:CocE/NonD family hydrolase [Duganella lactea]MYM84282.1 CocE/NonD family hydrolase [Duganella lactea]
MTIRLTLAACVAMIAVSTTAPAKVDMAPGASGGSTGSPDGAGDDEASLATSLLERYRTASVPAELSTRYLLQIAAGRFEDAERTIERLQGLYRPERPKMANALVPWRIYVQFRRDESRGMDAPGALKRAFDTFYGSLPNKRMADILPEYSANLDRLQATYDAGLKACADRPLRACATAADVIASHQALLAWQRLTPASAPLIRADAERRFIIDDRLLITTPDGAQIAAMTVRPREPAGTKRVALLNFTIYANDAWSFADAVKMAAHGYAGAVAYTRGKGRSPGTAVPYEHDGADAAAVINWLARQPWSDGRVGMFSGSYNASTQWAAVKQRPPALKAIATNASNAPGIDAPMQGNIFKNFIYPWTFYTTNSKGLDDRTYGDRSRWNQLNRNWYLSGRPYRDLDHIDGTPNPVFDTWLRHPTYDAYWQRLIPYGEEFAKIDIPVFVEAGYYDGGLVGALYYLQQHYRYRPSADHRLLVGPYHHTAMQTGVLPTVAGYDVDRAAMVDLQDIRLKWFDHVFHGAPLPEILRDRINFQVMGANRWRHLSNLAAMADRRQRLYLTGERQGDDLLFGSTAPTAGSAPELRVDMTDRSDVDLDIPADKPDIRNALVFTTAPLPEPVEVNGLFHVRFDVITNKRDFDLVVEFFEKRRDGKFLPLASYLGRASHMRDRGTRHLLRPGQPTTLTFSSQTLTARLLGAGSRIIAVIGVPKQPDMQINYGSGRPVSDESIADAGEPIIIKWRHGSYVDLGLH